MSIERDIPKLLAEITLPYDRKSIAELGYFQSSKWDEATQTLRLDFKLGFSSKTYEKALLDAVKNIVESTLPSVKVIDIHVDSQNIARKVQEGLKPLTTVKNIIAVSSGKGGVGKSATSINLALALQHEGFNVGVLDADIYGPSLPKMLGCYDQPISLDNKSMEPIIVNGLQAMSIGFLIKEEDAAIWRAPMAVSALTQLLNDTNWKALDFLVIDMPPGTGDIQLTLSQKIPVAGSVIVTTPQDLALIDARKGIDLFEKVNVPILGIIENMSTHICSNCHHEEAIFGTDGGIKLANEKHVPLLGQLPLDIRIRKALDEGDANALAHSDIALRYQEIAIKMVSELSQRPKDVAGKFPKIVIENK